MVYVYGGGFVAGSSASRNYNFSAFVERTGVRLLPETTILCQNLAKSLVDLFLDSFLTKHNNAFKILEENGPSLHVLLHCQRKYGLLIHSESG